MSTRPAVVAHVRCSQGHAWTEQMTVDEVRGEWRIAVRDTICPACGRAAVKLHGVTWGHNR